MSDSKAFQDPVVKHLQDALEALQKATELVRDREINGKRMLAMKKLERAKELWLEGRQLTQEAEELIKHISK